MRCPGEEADHLPVQCSGHCLLYPAETSNVTASCNWWPPHHEAWGEACMSWAYALWKMTVTRSIPYTWYMHHSHTDRTYSHHWRQQSAIPLSSSHTRVAVLGGGSLARGTCDLSPAASREFPMVLGDTVGATCVQISSLDAVQACTVCQSWHASVLRGRPELGLQVCECSTDHWYIVSNLCSNTSTCPSRFSQAYNATPFK